MGGHVGRKVGGVVVQYLVLMMVVDIRPWRGEVQGWWQVRRIELCAPILLMCLHWKMCPFLCLPTLVFCFTPSHHCPSTAEPSMAFAEQLAPAFAK